MESNQVGAQQLAFGAHESNYARLGRIMLAEVGAEECVAGYGTDEPALVGRLALGYGDINSDGTLN